MMHQVKPLTGHDEEIVVSRLGIILCKCFFLIIYREIDLTLIAIYESWNKSEKARDW